MRKLSKGEGVAVWLAVIVVFSAFLFGNNLFAFFSPRVDGDDEAMQYEDENSYMEDHDLMQTTPTITTTNPQSTTMQPHGLQITDLRVGTGAEAVAGKSITVNYRGTFPNGTQFDSSYDRGEPFTFQLGAGRVIQGWDQGFAGMKVGGKRKLVVSPEFGYGPNDYNGIPGNSTLLFEVELLDVK